MIEIESCDSTCNCQTLTPSSIHSERWDLIRVVIAQSEECELPDNGWKQIWCLDCDKCSDPFQGSLENFVDQIIKDGWAVHSVDKGTAICHACSNAQDEATYASQYEDERGLLG